MKSSYDKKDIRVLDTKELFRLKKLIENELKTRNLNYMKPRIIGTAFESKVVEDFEPLTCTKCGKKAVKRTIGLPGVPGLHCFNCGIYYCLKSLPDELRKEWNERG